MKDAMRLDGKKPAGLNNTWNLSVWTRMKDLQPYVKKICNYSAKKMKKVLDMVFLIFFTLNTCHTLVTRHHLAKAQTLAERA